MVRGMHGRVCAWQGDVCVRGGVHGGRRVHGRCYEIRSMSGRYAFYWNALLLLEVFVNKIAC